jgi:hypothetical protein
MAYSLSPGLFVEDGPAIHAADAASNMSRMRLLAWRKLDPDHRFEAVERILNAPANDLVDGLPLAL